MKAPTVATYQHYVLFRRAARNAIEQARCARACRKLGLERMAESHKCMSVRANIEARRYWGQVEMMEV